MTEKNLKRIFYIVIAVCLFAAMAAAMVDGQKLPAKTLSVTEMHADMKLLRRILSESHPNLYRGISPAAEARNWRRAERQISQPLTAMQFLNALNPLVSGYNDGHTYLDLPLNSDEYVQYGKSGKLFFPFRVWKKGERIYITENLGTSDLPPGTEILTINGEKTKTINRDLMSAMVGDSAANKSESVGRLFGLLLWQRHKRADDFQLAVRRPHQSKVEKISVRGINSEDFQKKMFGSKAAAFYELTPQTAVLEINKMQATDEVKNQIAGAFAQLKEKNYPAFVIDIRRNGGGNSIVADWVFEYLTNKPFRHSNVKEVRLSPYLIENNKYFRDWTIKLKEGTEPEGDKIILRSGDRDEAERKAEWIYKGKVYLLTGARTYSSAFMMAETFKCYRLGTMIGETPGSYRNLTGELQQFRLPNSRLAGYVSTSQYFPPCYEKEKTDFLAPDIKIEQTYEDLIGGRDSVLEYVRKNAGK